MMNLVKINFGTLNQASRTVKYYQRYWTQTNDLWKDFVATHKSMLKLEQELLKQYGSKIAEATDVFRSIKDIVRE